VWNVSIDYAETMKRILTILFLLLSMPVQAVEVYRSVDQYGNTVFSDQPSDDAEKIEVRELPVVPGMESIPSVSPRPRVVARYNAVSITSPANDQTYFRGDGDLLVTVRTEPRLSGADTLVLYLNDTEHASGRATSFTIPELDRGTHQLRVAIKDGSGNIVMSSAPITFHMRQASVLQPRTGSGQ